MNGREHRLMALEHANAVRMQTAQLRAQIRAAGPKGGAKRAADIVLQGESFLRVDRVLLAVPRIGDQTARHMLGVCRLNGMTRVRDIDPNRRQLLAGQLLRYAEAHR